MSLMVVVVVDERDNVRVFWSLSYIVKIIDGLKINPFKL